MNTLTILKIEKVALEFVKRCQTVRGMESRNVQSYYKEHSALKRQSMELTRALSELRRPHAY